MVRVSSGHIFPAGPNPALHLLLNALGTLLLDKQTLDTRVRASKSDYLNHSVTLGKTLVADVANMSVRLTHSPAETKQEQMHSLTPQTLF